RDEVEPELRIDHVLEGLHHVFPVRRFGVRRFVGHAPDCRDALPFPRLRAVVLLLVLLFIVVPIAEIYVIIQVGQAIGALWTILILIADSIIGARLLSWQGRRAWLKFQSALAEGRIPHREVLDGVLIIMGGAFLLTPGFITDVVGLILLLPPTRAVVRRALVRVLLNPRRARWARVGVRTGPVGPVTAEPRSGPGSRADRGLPPG